MSNKANQLQEVTMAANHNTEESNNHSEDAEIIYVCVKATICNFSPLKITVLKSF